MEIVKLVLELINVMISVYMLYYLFTGIGALFKNKKIKESLAKNKFAIIIPARNEENVIANLIDSLKKQDYPDDLYDIYVVPNNCKDNTENVARNMDVKVLNCNVPVKSKGDVLKFAFGVIPKQYDGYIIFDADNVVHNKFLEKMNNALCAGYQAAQGYRESKNPEDSWISNCYSIYHWVQNYFLNQARMNTGMSAFINGTGFMISKEILERVKFEAITMTEDTEMTIHYALAKEQIAFVNDAITYDEQPITFKESWKQRKRWSAGTLNCLHVYGKNLIKAKNKTSIDVLMILLMPIIQVLGVAICLLYTSIEVISTLQINYYIKLLPLLLGYGVSSLVAAFVIIISKKDIKKNIKGIVTFPIFVLSWILINVSIMLKRENVWEEMKHTRTVTIDMANEENVSSVAIKEVSL